LIGVVGVAAMFFHGIARYVTGPAGRHHQGRDD
jgi:hypothetical protein